MWSKQKSPRFAAEKTSNPVGGSQGGQEVIPSPLWHHGTKNGNTFEKPWIFLHGAKWGLFP